jgi:hypothetical protein
MTTRRAGGLRRAPERGLKTKTHCLMPITFSWARKSIKSVLTQCTSNYFQNLKRRNGIAFYSHTGRAGGLRNFINYYKDYSRKNVDEESPAGIVIGVTTREKVLLTLGEPDKVYENESEFWYIATKVKLIWGVYGGSGGEVRKTYNHVFRFDRNGLVETLRLTDKGESRKSP